MPYVSSLLHLRMGVCLKRTVLRCLAGAWLQSGRADIRRQFKDASMQLLTTNSRTTCSKLYQASIYITVTMWLCNLLVEAHLPRNVSASSHGLIQILKLLLLFKTRRALVNWFLVVIITRTQRMRKSTNAAEKPKH